MDQTQPPLRIQDPLLNIQDLSYRYGDRQAVRQVSFQIQAGEIFGLLGPNGAGKTTTISCLSGLLSRWEGSLHFLGESFRPGKVADHRQRLGVVPQELALYEEMTAAENLVFFGKLSGLAGNALLTACDRALNLSGLEDRAQDRVKTYSGGMKRRLNLAIGELHSPELLLLDEPTVGVDPQSRNHIFESLKQLKLEGRTLLYTTHYMEEAERLCDRIAIMNDGVIAGVGTQEELGRLAGSTNGNLEEIFLQLTGRSLRD